MSEPKSSNNRWWESYLVRYLSGSIIGSICVFSIVLFFLYRYGFDLNDFKSIFNVFKRKDFPVSIIFIVLIISGLTYSYLISSPITVFHYGRAGQGFFEKQVRFIWLGWSGFLLSYILFSGNFIYIFNFFVLTSVLSLIRFEFCQPKIFRGHFRNSKKRLNLYNNYMLPVKSFFCLQLYR